MSVAVVSNKANLAAAKLKRTVRDQEKSQANTGQTFLRAKVCPRLGPVAMTNEKKTTADVSVHWKGYCYSSKSCPVCNLVGVVPVLPPYKKLLPVPALLPRPGG